ncbi:MAG: threonine synthase [Bacteroidia bacterium]|nr:threonine synthase [Bacteroidia bacterium]
MNSPTFYSTNLKTSPVSFSAALLKGIAPDKGLFLPEVIPHISPGEIRKFSEMEYYQVAYEVSRQFLAGEIGDTELLLMVRDAYNFDIPLEHVVDRKYIMRLDQGPTASFKDFAARMMGRLMQYYLKKNNQSLLILTATSGDTGSAIANAFYGLKNINVVVLFPEDEVTSRQRKQMTTLGGNVQIIGLNAKFDDCQAMVKEAFADHELDHLCLSSANSINIGRLIPQIVYYFYSFSRLRKNNDEQVIFSIPSGNFGDMMGGVLAMKMGLPVKKFVIATNENDEFPVFMRSGIYSKIEPSKNCISSAMNVGHPSNLARLVAVYGGVMDEAGNISKIPDMEMMRNELFPVSINDDMTRDTIIQAWNRHKLLLEPHGSVGWAGLWQYLDEHPADNTADQLCISLETAHPAKFPEQIRKLINIDPDLPPSLEGIESKQESYLHFQNDYRTFKEFLLNNYKK